MLLPNNINLPARCRLVFKKNRWFICISKPTRGVLMGVEPTESSSKRGVVGALDEFDGVAKQREEGPSEDDEGEGGVEVDSDELGGSGRAAVSTIARTQLMKSARASRRAPERRTRRR